MNAAFALFLISTISTVFAGSLIKLPASPDTLIAMKQRAEAGDVRAQVALGDEMNKSLKYSAAEHWYRAAASQGDPDGLCSLAELYHSNRGFGTNATKGNFTNALTLHRLASLQGHKRSHFHLGFAYMEGQVLKRDLIQAYAHFNVSGKNAVVDSRLKQLIFEMSPEQIALAQNQVKNFRPLPFRQAFEEMVFQSIRLQAVMVGTHQTTALLNGRLTHPGDQLNLSVAGLPAKLVCNSIEPNSVILSFGPTKRTFSLRAVSQGG